ncbi:MAG TPA: LysR family transcriptional regulator, partial [Solirubrobacteraceae bacterium]|nr:LysR family transcriptional regulator [Solirubrobacteraceae bacterium]
MLDVRRLQTLRAVAREGSLTAAAKALGYTQPAVSHHIARLEEEVGTAVLTRLGRGVRLTDAGRALVEHADAVLARLAAAEEDVAAIAGLRAGRVRIAAFPSASATLMAGALGSLRARHPGVEVAFAEAEPEDALPRLRAGDLDLVVGFSYKAVGSGDGRDLDAQPLLRDPSLAVLPPDHPHASGDGPLDLADLAGDTWIAGCERCRGHLVHLARNAGFEPPIAYATDDYVTVQSLVAGGLGVTLLPSLALAAARRDDVAVRSVAGAPGRTVEVVLPLAGRHPPAVAAMLGSLREAAAALAATPGAASL